jgi:hypothetical protein
LAVTKSSAIAVDYCTSGRIINRFVPSSPFSSSEAYLAQVRANRVQSAQLTFCGCKKQISAEAKARIRINELLSKSGWRFFADENGPANVHLEAHVKLTKKILDDLGNDFEKTTHGCVDYRSWTRFGERPKRRKASDVEDVQTETQEIGGSLM